jgi:serine carboxypeptidase-like clade 1
MGGRMVKLFEMLFIFARYACPVKYITFQIQNNITFQIQNNSAHGGKIIKLHDQGTIKDWRRCNKTLAYSYNVKSTVDYHRNLTKKPYRALIYR